MRNLVHTINTLEFKRRCNAALLCSNEASAHAQLIIFGATKSRGTNTAHATLQSSSQGEKDSTSVALSS